MPDDVESAIQGVTLDAMELGPGEKAAMSLTCRRDSRLSLTPSPTRRSFWRSMARRRRSAGICRSFLPTRMRTTARQDPAGSGAHLVSKSSYSPDNAGDLVARRGDGQTHQHPPAVPTATRLLSNQAFRDLYRSGTFDPEQRFKITSLTILFTDLKGSTALYERIGDLAAFDLVRNHFGALFEAVSAEGGAVVKTIGDAVMATFPRRQGAAAAMRMREAMREINQTRGGEDLALNIGLHSGRSSRSCSTIGRLGQTVNVASRVNELADQLQILAASRSSKAPRWRAYSAEQATERPRSSRLGTERRIRDLRGARTRGRRRRGVSGERP